MRMCSAKYLTAVFVIMLVSASPSLAQTTLGITGVGIFDLGTGAPEGLSGLTRASGTQYYAADDSGGLLRPMTINVNPSTGAVSSASFGATVTLNGRADMEGIAYAGSDKVYVSDETGATITKYNVSGGSALSSVTIPAVYSNYRSNYSFESLTMRSNGLEMWTANEEALTVDGPLSTASTGTVVRLQKFTRANTSSSWTAGVQYAYNTLSWGGNPWFPSGSERSGVSDMCVLPNGKLLVLERSLGNGGFFPSFENHIFLVDTSDATDISEKSGLIGESYTAASKEELWLGNFGNDNFEGLCLGPQLADVGGEDCHSLLMISDGDGSPDESLYALRITGEIPEPATMSLLALGGLAMLRRRRK